MSVTLFFTVALITVIVIFIILLIAWWVNKVDEDDFPSTVVPVIDSKVPLAPAPAPAPEPVKELPGVAKIVVIKDSTKKTQHPGDGEWKTFQIGEISIYDKNTQKITSDKFSLIKYDQENSADRLERYPATNIIDGRMTSLTHTSGDNNVHSITLELKEPTEITKMVVYNNNDFNWRHRLEGTEVRLYSNIGRLLATYVLSKEYVQTIGIGY
jgi:hypothetical protein